MNRRRFKWYAIAVGCLVIGISAKFYNDQSEPWRGGVVSITDVADDITSSRVAFVSGHGRFYSFVLTARVDAVNGRLVELREQDSPQLAKALAEDGILAVNGGYFDEKFRPLGLMRINGRDVSRRIDHSPFSACIVTDSSGRMGLIPSKDPRVVSAVSARQCGPFIIDPGGTIGVKPGGDPAQRTVIATGDNKVVVIFTNAVRLFDLATCLHDFPQLFGVSHFDNAACLDGGPSSGFVMKTGVNYEPAGRITDALVLSPRSVSAASTTQP